MAASAWDGRRGVHDSTPHVPVSSRAVAVSKDSKSWAGKGVDIAVAASRGSRAKRWAQRRGVPPTQQQLDLNSRIHRCESVEQLLLTIEGTKTKQMALSNVNVITAISKMAKIKSRGKHQRVGDMLQEVLLRTLATRLAARPSDVGSREIATLAWSLTKLKAYGKYEGLWTALEDIIADRGMLCFRCSASACA